MTARLKHVAESAWFTNLITAVIIAAGIIVGAETYGGFAERYHTTLSVLNQIVLWIFVVEIVIKMGAEGRQPWRYFADPWNVFDFAIVAVCFLPIDAQGAAVLRLARLLRVLKLVKALPKLQVLVTALLKSIPSMGYVSLLLFLLFYLYAVAATMLFGDNDPVHFATLQQSMLSLFRAVTLEDWTDLMYIQMYGCGGYGYDGMIQLCTASKAQPVLGASFFVSFVLIGTMVILNLFVGVIMTGMDEAKEELEQQNTPEPDGLAAELAQLNAQVEALHAQLARVRLVADTPRERAAK